MANLDIYERRRVVPKEAIKPIQAGRLKGMSDINPMFRIKSLTEEFGACGIGWYYTVDKKWVETYGAESVAFVDISLYIKVDNEWSKPIHGTGGSKIVAMESKGAYVSDEAYKMATTDAISVACKQLGIGADIYWQNDRTKYSSVEAESKPQKQAQQKQSIPQQNVQPVQQDDIDRQLNEPVDPDMLVHGEGMTPRRLAKLKKAQEFTGKNDKTVLATAHATTFEAISEVSYVSVMELFLKLLTPEQKAEIEAIK